MRSGFTLIELLVVISIIGLLSSVVITNINDNRERAYDTVRISDVNEIQKAIELYIADYQQPPPNGGASSAGNFSFSKEECDNLTPPKPGWCDLRTSLAPYINLPTAPKNGQDVQLVIGGITYWHELRYFYRVFNGIYGIMTVLTTPGNYRLMQNDGGGHNTAEPTVIPMYEVGTLPKYCGSRYTGINANWWGFTDSVACTGDIP